MSFKLLKKIVKGFPIYLQNSIRNNRVFLFYTNTASFYKDQSQKYLG
jgi:hypothetical protein